MRVIDEACQQLENWKSKDIKIKMAVNLSPGQMHHNGLVNYVEEIMHRYNINKGELEFEATETAAMADVKSAIEQMKLLRHAGVDFAIDDFGTGYSSLAYLKLFPIQTLKIDNQVQMGESNTIVNPLLQILNINQVVVPRFLSLVPYAHSCIT
ncbi:MAG: EAL domain-containing protein [gamma proteobacterium symbiont of Taylorina sp.]|nr:EAL domain-containing protein [gamma proteobacterium symbiont of Taylorina sp.]